MKDRISELTMSQTGASGVEMKNGRVELSNVAVPNVAIAPNATFRVILTVKNHETIIVNDPDGCSQPGTPCTDTRDGYCLRAQAGIDSLSSQQDFCLNLPFTGVPPNTERVVFDLRTPEQPGTYQVQAKLRATNSTEETTTVSQSITVDEGGATDPQTPDGSPTDGLFGDISFDKLLIGAFLLVVLSIVGGK